MDALIDTSTAPTEEVRRLAAAGSLFAILDACDSPAVPPKVEELGEARAVSLYRGLPEEEFAAFAPYLAQAGGELIPWIERTLWHEPWGYFLVSAEPLAALRSHLRRFLIVDDPARKQMYFRFYDPRVLRKLMPVLNVGELRELFGPITRFLVSSADHLDSFALTPFAASYPVARAARPIGQRFLIREPVMAAFGAEADAAFEARLIAHLRDQHAGAVAGLSDRLLLPLVRAGVARARGYGMRSEANLTAFTALMFAVAPNFDKHARTQMILGSSQLAPEKKIDVLLEQTPADLWKELKRRADPRAWHEPSAGVR